MYTGNTSTCPPPPLPGWAHARSAGSHLNILKYMLSYGWRFSRYSALIHWLVHGHMTSSSKTVYHQIPRASKIHRYYLKRWTLLNRNTQLTYVELKQIDVLNKMKTQPAIVQMYQVTSMSFNIGSFLSEKLATEHSWSGRVFQSAGKRKATFLFSTLIVRHKRSTDPRF